MITIISGTNRKNSISKVIASIYLETLYDIGYEGQIIDLADLPKDFVFSALYENAGENDAFNKIVARMNKSDKYVFIVPEYNGSFPGILKAFIDGLPYPGSFKGKTCGLLGISSGKRGAVQALNHLTDIFSYCGMTVLPQKPKFPRIDKNIRKSILSNALYSGLIEQQARTLMQA